MPAVDEASRTGGRRLKGLARKLTARKSPERNPRDGKNWEMKTFGGGTGRRFAPNPTGRAWIPPRPLRVLQRWPTWRSAAALDTPAGR